MNVTTDTGGLVLHSANLVLVLVTNQGRGNCAATSNLVRYALLKTLISFKGICYIQRILGSPAGWSSRSYSG